MLCYLNFKQWTFEPYLFIAKFEDSYFDVSSLSITEFSEYQN